MNQFQEDARDRNTTDFQNTKLLFLMKSSKELYFNLFMLNMCNPTMTKIANILYV